jgi:predicted DNA-binding transcriptional regulator YafY
MRLTAVADDAALAPPDGFDPVEHVSRSLARVPWPWEVELDEGTLLTMRVSSLDWMARVLAGLECDFAIRRPDELRGSARALADRLAASS